MLQNDETREQPCPCGSHKPYRQCCEPAISGLRPAATAEALMRSRYTAFALGLPDYLVETLAPEKRHPDEAALLAEQMQATVWTGLRIVDCRAGGPGARRGEVEFIASFETPAEKGQLHERSRFRRDGQGRWVYVDGDVEVARA
ncbi:YchJ family protein [Marinobacterium aestuariivivens]|uniref:YchJ family protein n=1 Tax=Marinobacterium aestuariivivens TaxID=1698799 RepID=A0ABW1ZWF8_9GAMM